MLVIGPHISISKGFSKAASTAVDIGANTFQFFSRNPRGGNAKEFDEINFKKIATEMTNSDFIKLANAFDELQIGDYIVHEENGIGRYEGVVTLEANSQIGDYLKIMYAKDQILYVPLSKFSTIRKYVSREGAVPRLSRIGGKDWSNTKQKIKEKVNFLADRLIELYAKRETTPGFAFQKDDEFQEDFEKAFPYNLTVDQEKAINDIKEDMEKPYPMDRLLCGDVGFGKTEVAFRAAFKAINSGKQVALLCPTTILAKQHYDVASS